MSDLKKLTKAELKELAEERGIEVKSSDTKAEIIEALQTPKVDPNIIMSGVADLPSKSATSPKAKPPEVDKSTIKVDSKANLYQEGWGRLTKGINEISKKAAEYWLTHPKVKRVE